MSASNAFDPYHRWLGISPQDQPPHHYRLLGVDLFEKNPEVIAIAADRQMAHLRGFQAGEHSRESQQLLNAVAAARVCLLNAAKKAAYDRDLRAQLLAQSPPLPATSEAAMVAPLPPPPRLCQLDGVPLALEFLDQPTPAGANGSGQPEPDSPRSNCSLMPIYLGAVAIILLLLIATGLAILQSRRGNPLVVSKAMLSFDVPEADRAAVSLWLDEERLNVPAKGVVHGGCQPGAHRIRATRPGYQPCEQTITLAAGEHKTIRLQWKQECCLVLAWPVAARDGAVLQVDRQPRQLSDRDVRAGAERVEVPLEPGLHTLGISRPGFEDFRQKFELVEGEQTVAPVWVAVAKKPLPAVVKPSSGGEKPPGPPKPPPIAKKLPEPKRPPPPNPPAAKQPVPDDAAVEKALADARDAFAVEYEKAKTAPEKLALAEKLTDLARKAADRPAEQFALLLSARELAVGALDPKAAFAAIDQTGKSFAIDPVAAKVESLAAIAGKALKSADRKTVIEESLDLMRRAVESETFPLATELATAASDLAGKLHDKDLLQRTRAAQKQLTQEITAAGELQAAREKLKKEPADAEANLTVGAGLCLFRGDWKAGLPYLAKGSDERLRAAAQAEVPAPPADAAAQVKLADAWWELASAEPAPRREQLLLHAGAWYERAQARGLSTLAKARVEKHLDIVATVDPSVLPAGSASPPPAVAPFGEKMARLHQVSWARYLRVPAVQTNSAGIKLLIVPPGEFDMGTSAEEVARLQAELPDDKNKQWLSTRIAAEAPQHRVKITRAFYLGVTKVTQAEFQRVMGSNPSQHVGDTDRPVEHVTWEEAVEFCRKLSAMPKEKAAHAVYRLPTEAEWEYACRAGTVTRYSFGDSPGDLNLYAWWSANCQGRTQPVGKLHPNAWSLFDMLGNSSEWCADLFSRDYYAASPAEDPPGPSAGHNRVLRGSPIHERQPVFLGCAHRESANSDPPKGEKEPRRGEYGFRIARTIAP